MELKTRLLLLVILAGGIATPEPHRGIYRILATGCGDGGREGTGFRVAGEAGILTALHVVNQCRRIRAIPDHPSDNSEAPLFLCAASPQYDAAVLARSESDCSSLPALSEESGVPQAGKVNPQAEETLYVIGYPVSTQQLRRPVFLFRRRQNPTTELDQLGLPGSVLKELGISGKATVIAVGASVAQGDSGAPLMNQDSEVVGMVDGGRRERGPDAEPRGLVGITWAMEINALLASLRPASELGSKLTDIDYSSAQELFSVSPRFASRGVEFTSVTLSSERLWVMVSEATRSEYRSCYNAGACTEEVKSGFSASEVPAAISAKAAGEFCKWLGAEVPLQAEWIAIDELGLRFTPTGLATCMANLSGASNCPSARILPVRRTQPNGLGLYDFRGNLWEWVRPGASSTNLSVAGGAFNTPIEDLSRNPVRAGARRGTVGVRCVIR